jgi:hypothetical protein
VIIIYMVKFGSPAWVFLFLFCFLSNKKYFFFFF